MAKLRTKAADSIGNLLSNVQDYRHEGATRKNIYDPVTDEIPPTKADKVAAWFIDGDYDGRTFCITQAFFPDRTAWDKLARALKGVLDPEAFEAFSGTTSLSFAPGPNKAVAIKVIDPRGNEVMKVHKL